MGTMEDFLCRNIQHDNKIKIHGSRRSLIEAVVHVNGSSKSN